MKTEETWCEDWWRLRAELKEQKEINNMLQKNMFYYEYRCRDARIEVLKLEDKVRELEKKLEELQQPKGPSHE